MYYYPAYYGASGDVLYLALLAAVVFSMAASWHVKSVYKKYQDDCNRRGITGAQAANEILHRNGIYDVPVREIPGASLTDYYDPKNNSISLSSDVAHGDYTGDGHRLKACCPLDSGRAAPLQIDSVSVPAGLCRHYMLRFVHAFPACYAADGV